MTTLRAYAHHGPVPSNFQLNLVPSHLPAPDGPQPIKEYWCELVPQSAVDSPGSGAPCYGQAAAIAPDQSRYDIGFATGADDFNVSNLCVLLVGATREEYDYVLISPAGQSFPIATAGFGPIPPLAGWGDARAPQDRRSARGAP